MGYLNRYLNRYLNARLVFFIDLALSVVSSGFVLLTLNFMSSSEYYRGPFALWWMCGSVLGSVVGMLLVKEYKVVVRHTTLRDMVRYILTLLVKVGLMAAIVAITCLINSSVVLALTYDLLLTLFLLIAVVLREIIVLILEPGILDILLVVIEIRFFIDVLGIENLFIGKVDILGIIFFEIFHNIPFRSSVSAVHDRDNRINTSGDRKVLTHYAA